MKLGDDVKVGCWSKPAVPTTSAVRPVYPGMPPNSCDAANDPVEISNQAATGPSLDLILRFADHHRRMISLFRNRRPR
jgi:hypothetical protein